ALLLRARPGIEILDGTYSSVAAEAMRVESAIDAGSEELLDPLVALVNSPAIAQRVIGLRALRAIISPRARRQARLTQGTFQRDEHFNMTTAGDHPRAGEIRRIAMAVFNELNSDKLSIRDRSWIDTAMFELIAELADQSTIDT